MNRYIQSSVMFFTTWLLLKEVFDTFEVNFPSHFAQFYVSVCSGKSFTGGKARVAERPERLLARLRTASLEEANGPRVVALRAPRGPDGTRGFRPRRTVAGTNYIYSCEKQATTE